MEKELLNQRKQIILDIINDDNYIPMKIKELAIVLNVPKENREDLEEVLKELLAEGRISVSKKGKYGKPSGNILVGTYEGNAKGFGFVTVEGETEDIFIPESASNGALNEDLVQVVLRSGKGGKRREGEIIKILEHGVTELVGTYQKSQNFGFVVPDNNKISRDIFIPIEKSKGAMTGHKVVVKISSYGDKNKKPEGVVKEIIGHINDPGTDILSVVKSLNIPMEFPDEVMKQVERIPNEVDSKDMAGRMDIRDWQTVTIDGEDAKDLDDAITVQKEGNRYVLGVHIADVANYVQEHTPLDKVFIWWTG